MLFEKKWNAVGLSKPTTASSRALWNLWNTNGRAVLLQLQFVGRGRDCGLLGCDRLLQFPGYLVNGGHVVLASSSWNVNLNP